jgi:acetoin utilization deacetylase AcuC-like enzyme
MFTQIPVFFHSNQVAPADIASPSPYKPALVVADWQARGFPIRIKAPSPVSRDQLALAHERRFVDGVLDLAIDNGFGNRSEKVAKSLPWTSGSLLCAAREALANRQVAVSPTSGFHHACYGRAGGYCTFNGLMVAAVALLRDGAVRRIGILDCDFHYGNGTDDIIHRLSLRDHVRHATAGHGYPMRAEAFLAQLPRLVAGFADCDLLIYQAGADPHVNDPLGGFLTTEQLMERDRIVFRSTALLGIPVAWNLAGGYQDPVDKVVRIHANTMQACIEAYFDPSEDVSAEPQGQPDGATV